MLLLAGHAVLAEDGEQELLEDEDLMGPIYPGPLSHDVLLELPDWQSDDVREFDQNAAPVNLGGGLWPAELWPIQPEPARLPPEPKLPKAPEILASSAELADGVMLPEELRSAYFGQQPPEMVVDPQSLVDEQRQEELDDFLADCNQAVGSLQVRVLVFDDRQTLPPSLPVQDLAARWFPGQEAVVVFYFNGRPDRSFLAYSTMASRRFSELEMHESLNAAIREARVADRPQEQFTRFCLKFPIKLHQMQRDHVDVPAQTEEGADASPAASRSWLLWLLLLGLSTLVGALVAWRILRNRAAQGPWHFPEREWTTRLGGPHSGGAGSEIQGGK